MRAAEALRARFATKKGARVRLEKRIPAQAGLGGGSSDAAATLIALALFWELDVVRQDLIEIGAGLGADVPFFLFGGTARGTGIGDQVTPIPDATEKFLLIVKPNANVSTGSAYKSLGERSLTTRNPKTILSSSPPTDAFANGSLVLLGNDFEEVVLNLEPEISRAKAALMNAGAQAAMLAGSGSAVFGVFVSEDAQRRAIQAIELEAGWRVFPCKTVGRKNYLKAFGDLSLFASGVESIEPAPAGASRYWGVASGKAPVFGIGIRRFESFRPSQSFKLDVRQTLVCRNLQIATSSGLVGH